MKSIDIIHDEHRALGAVLQALRFVVGELSAGRLQPDFRLLAAMFDYITQVPEKLHHPKEDDCLFPVLRRRSAKAAELIDRLEQQHAQGRQMTVKLFQALIRYQHVGAASLPAFDAQVKDYLDFHWMHLKLEEAEFLPLARELLTDQDWAEIDAQFAANCDPWTGAEGEFRELFARIVNLTPAPYGLGPAN